MLKSTILRYSACKLNAANKVTETLYLIEPELIGKSHHFPLISITPVVVYVKSVTHAGDGGK